MIIDAQDLFRILLDRGIAKEVRVIHNKNIAFYFVAVQLPLRMDVMEVATQEALCRWYLSGDTRELLVVALGDYVDDGGAMWRIVNRKYNEAANVLEVLTTRDDMLRIRP